MSAAPGSGEDDGFGRFAGFSGALGGFQWDEEEMKRLLSVVETEAERVDGVAAMAEEETDDVVARWLSV